MSEWKFSAQLNTGGCGLKQINPWKIASLPTTTAMEKAEKRLQAILKKSKQSGLDNSSLSRLEIVKVLCRTEPSSGRKFYSLLVLLVCVLAGVLLTPNSECLLEMPVDSSKVFREAENCNMCIGVTQVDKVKNISPEDFDELYAATYKPVVITDGTRGWSAVQTFDFEFFKNLYTNRTSRTNECQFFPYKTEFQTLSEALNMDSARSRFEEGTVPWYIGWSNCNDDAGKILRQHYERPYFLAETSENIALSWIFMGGPGDGAHMHVDNVRYPSWQAQLRGRKKWRLAPPPECLYSCHEFQVIVEPGEIIVVDTNRWYHQTHILPGDISITIGSEFD